MKNDNLKPANEVEAFRRDLTDRVLNAIVAIEELQGFVVVENTKGMPAYCLTVDHARNLALIVKDTLKQLETLKASL